MRFQGLLREKTGGGVRKARQKLLILLIITSTPAPDSSTDSAWETSSSGSFLGLHVKELPISPKPPEKFIFY